MKWELILFIGLVFIQIVFHHSIDLCMCNQTIAGTYLDKLHLLAYVYCYPFESDVLHSGMLRFSSWWMLELLVCGLVLSWWDGMVYCVCTLGSHRPVSRFEYSWHAVSCSSFWHQQRSNNDLSLLMLRDPSILWNLRPIHSPVIGSAPCIYSTYICCP